LNVELTSEDEIVLQYLLDYAHTGFTNEFKFSEFLKAFGPLRGSGEISCLKNMKLVLREKWFVGYLSREESQIMLTNKPPGTFLVRFSGSVGAFAIAFRGNDQVYHIKVKSLAPGFSVYEQKTRCEKTFRNIHEVVQFHHYALTEPYTDNLPFESYFHGELTSEESNDLLFGEPQGTYLLRFSTSIKGAFACSYVYQDQKIKHLIFQREDDLWYLSTKLKSGFSTLQELLDSQSDTLKKPLFNSASQVREILQKWNDDVVEIDKIITNVWKPFLGE